MAVERAYERIRQECGCQTDREVHVPAWDRWRWRCTAPTCTERGLTYAPPAGPCGLCGGALDPKGEEAVLDLEVRSAWVPKLFLDVTVRHSVPGEGERLARAARTDGAVNLEAEREKESRYPAARAPHKVAPLAVETFGRHGKQALKYLRKLARKKAETLDEGGDQAVSALVLRWGCQLSVALQRANAANLRRSLGAQEVKERLRSELASEAAR